MKCISWHRILPAFYTLCEHTDLPDSAFMFAFMVYCLANKTFCCGRCNKRAAIVSFPYCQTNNSCLNIRRKTH